jgi:hypothetical protein
MLDLLPNLLDEYGPDEYLFIVSNSRDELDDMITASVMRSTRLAQDSGMISLQSAIDMARYYRKRLDEHYERYPETRVITPTQRGHQLRHLDGLQESADDHRLDLAGGIRREEQQREKARQTNQKQMRLRVDNLALKSQRRSQKPRKSEYYE